LYNGLRYKNEKKPQPPGHRSPRAVPEAERLEPERAGARYRRAAAAHQRDHSRQARHHGRHSAASREALRQFGALLDGPADGFRPRGGAERAYPYYNISGLRHEA